MNYRFHRPKTRHWNQKLLRHCGKWKPALRDYFPCELKFEYRTRLTSNDDVLLFSMLSCDVAFTNSLSSSLICTKEMKIQQHFRKKIMTVATIWKKKKPSYLTELFAGFPTHLDFCKYKPWPHDILIQDI